MPLSESLLQSFGALELPAVENAADGTLASLDPGRDQLLALFKAAINSELGAAWAAVVDGTRFGEAATPLPVMDTLPARPTEQTLTQRRSDWPLLCLHRDGRGTFEDHTIGNRRLTQPWKLHWIVGPIDLIDQRKVLDAGQAIAKVIDLVIQQRGHLAYEGGALQFFTNTSSFAGVDLKGYQGPDQAGFAGDRSTTFFWAVELDLETVEVSNYREGSFGLVDALDVTAGVGGGEGVQPALVIGSSDAEPSAA